jgi:hypothetical protein
MLKQASAICQSCGVEFTPKRSWQGYCSAACANQDRQKRRRHAKKCRDMAAPVSQPTECRDTGQATPRVPLPAKPEAIESYGFGHSDDLKPSLLDGKLVLFGDDYQLDYYADGYPKIPECLDRRAPRKAKAA